ncbi:hypothetical protein SAMN05421776_105182 [Nocardia farcinica]|uniref:Uncharacterized protein n=1 Tax=Nocardia farcinica TaxID=37329 RepID=A0A0H5NEK0_NOCFR|nr:Uncharacterised protein [Nocardia farcinica]SIT23892.1 hypothetical protein SAMN05421776_105182 [Nocardia farcinica]
MPVAPACTSTVSEPVSAAVSSSTVATLPGMSNAAAVSVSRPSGIGVAASARAATYSA